MIGIVTDSPPPPLHFCAIRVQILVVEGKKKGKKEKKSKFLTRLRSKRENLQSQPQSADSQIELLDMIRIQMEASCNFPLNHGVPTLEFSANCTF